MAIETSNSYDERPIYERVGFYLPNFSPRNQEIQVLAEAENFYKLAPQAWGPNTIHPDYQYEPGDPTGQCGVTIAGFAIWLVWREVVTPAQITLNRGKIVDEENGIVGDHHAHIELALDDEHTANILRLGIDLTADQFARVKEGPGAFHLDYSDSTIRGKLGEDFTHTVEKSTPFMDYDTGKFGWRMIDFMGHFYPKHTFLNLNLGRKAVRGSRDDMWWPSDKSHTIDEIFDRLEATPKIEIPQSMAKPASGKRVPRHRAFTSHYGHRVGKSPL